MWQPVGDKRDIKHAFFDGPWVIAGHNLLVQRWQPKLFPFEDEFKRIAVWVCLPGLPIEYYEKHILWRIGDNIGRPMRIDSNILCENEGTRGDFVSTERAKFVRVCIEVDFRKLLVSKFELHNQIYNVEYEGLLLECFGCGRYVHKKEACPLNMPKDQPTNSMEVKNGADKSHLFFGRSNVDREKEDDFGPWMLVQRDARRRRGGARVLGMSNGETLVAVGKQGGAPSLSGSQFQILDGAKVTDPAVKGINSVDMGSNHGAIPEVKGPLCPHPDRVPQNAGRKDMNKKKNNQNGFGYVTNVHRSHEGFKSNLHEGHMVLVEFRKFQ